MSILPAFLKKGDKIAIAAPARKVSINELEPFIKLCRQHELEVVFTENLFSTQHQFAGSDQQRASDFQYWLDNSDVKAIISAKGGYGTARIIDALDFTKFKVSPKWLIGFSDFTVIHNHVNTNFNIATLHASMPAYLKEDASEDLKLSFSTLIKALKGENLRYPIKPHLLNIAGNCKGTLVGGNLSVIYSIMGSASELNTDNCILFLEDLDEYLYHMDRMMVCLKRAGKLKKLNGILVGHMNSMHDNPIPFGQSVEEIIREHAYELNIPVYFGFDAGHLNPNFPLIFGTEVEIENNCLIFGQFLS